MNKLLNIFGVAFLGLTIVGGNTAQAQIIPLKDPGGEEDRGEKSNEDERYMLVAITNDTNEPMTYFFRWGEEGEWGSVTVLPGYTQYHWLTFTDQRVEDLPPFIVSFEGDTGTSQAWAQYSLAANVAATYPEDDWKAANQEAKHYRFVYAVENDERLIDMTYDG